MGLLDKLKQAFSGGGSATDRGIYFYVRCNRCGDHVRVRLDPASELQQEFSESGEGVGGYSVRKMVVDQRCFRPMETRISFDSKRRERSREIEGGSFVTREEYEAARPAGA